MARQFFSETFRWVTADGTAVANTTTETAIFTAPTLPADYMSDGRVLRIRAFGKLSTTGTPTIAFGLRFGTATGGVLLAVTEAMTNGSGVANVNWALDIIVQTRSNGATGTLLAMGEASLHSAAGTVLANVFGVSGYDAPAVATCDLTAATALTLTATWSAASASNTLTGMICTIESLN